MTKQFYVYVLCNTCSTHAHTHTDRRRRLWWMIRGRLGRCGRGLQFGLVALNIFLFLELLRLERLERRLHALTAELQRRAVVCVVRVSCIAYGTRVRQSNERAESSMHFWLRSRAIVHFSFTLSGIHTYIQKTWSHRAACLYPTYISF